MTDVFTQQRMSAAMLQKEWRQHRGVRRSEGRQCVLRLAGVNRCDSCGPWHNDFRNGSDQPDCQGDGRGSLFDHASLWVKDGEPSIFVFQPYGISGHGLAVLTTFCDEYGLEASIDTRPAWHYPGYVLMVEVTKVDDDPFR